MQTGRIVQAVLLMWIVAIVSSCAASKDYSSKLFAPRIPVTKDTQALAFRFLDFDGTEVEKENWVTTDIIMGRDTVSKTIALDKLSKVFPASPVAAKTTTTTQPRATVPDQTKPLPEETEPVARHVNPGEVRTKKTREPDQ